MNVGRNRQARIYRVAVGFVAAITVIGLTAAAAPPTQAAGTSRLPSAATGPRPATAENPAAALAAEFGLTGAEARQRLASQPERVALGERLTRRLGSRAGGFYLDQKADTVVVNVVDERAAAAVRRAGATATLVDHSTAELTAAQKRIARLLPTHTSAGLDVKTNQVVVRIGSAASDANVNRLLTAAGRLGDTVRVERFDGAYRTAIFDGDPIVAAGGGYCTLGFHTTGGTALTAGHCTQAIAQWYDGCTGQFFGTSIVASFPSNDFGLIRNDGGLPQTGIVRLSCGAGQADVVTAANPVVGLSLCKSGATTGITCGTVQSINQVVCYSQGCVDNMAVTNAAVLPGDSGGPWYAGSGAYGLTSGYVTDGSASFFQPVSEALGALGLGLL